MMFLWWMWAALFFAGPFAIFTGLVGMTVLTRTRRRMPSFQHYLAESTALGAMLGASYPAVSFVLRLTRLASWGYFALGTVSGAACGLVVGYLSIRTVLDATVTLET